MIELLIASLALAAGSMIFSGSDDQSDEITENEQEPVTDGYLETLISSSGETLTNTVPPADVTTIDDGFGNTQITIENRTSGDAEGTTQFIGGEFITYDTQKELVNVNDGAGDDTIVVANGYAHITTGAGNDTVDASGLEIGTIEVNSGDIVFGSNAAAEIERVGILAEGDVTVRGGTSDETIIAVGGGGLLDGGGGDDVLFSGNGSDTLIGGAGDDRLQIFDELRLCQCSRISATDYWIDFAVDNLDGGAGNDILELSNGDIGTGGDGEDDFRVNFYDPDEFPDNPERNLGPAIVTDFEVGSETATIQMTDGIDETQPERVDLTGRISVHEDAGDTRIVIDGETAAVFEDATGLRVGHVETGFSEKFVDTDTGIVAPRSAFDVVIDVHLFLT